MVRTDDLAQMLAAREVQRTEGVDGGRSWCVARPVFGVRHGLTGLHRREYSPRASDPRPLLGRRSEAVGS
jgi:hypothetical protein